MVILNVDGASYQTGAGVDLQLRALTRERIELAIQLDFFFFINLYRLYKDHYINFHYFVTKPDQTVKEKYHKDFIKLQKKTVK